jgi:hypothetical protein
MRGPTYTFWTNLTPFLLEAERALAHERNLHRGGRYASLWDNSVFVPREQLPAAARAFEARRAEYRAQVASRARWLAVSCCTAAQPLYPRFTGILAGSLSEAAMRPDPLAGGAADRRQLPPPRRWERLTTQLAAYPLFDLPVVYQRVSYQQLCAIFPCIMHAGSLASLCDPSVSRLPVLNKHQFNSILAEHGAASIDPQRAFPL